MNARLDYEQMQDQDEHEQRVLQALMNITASGLRQEADFLAAECGMWTVWKQKMRLTNAN